ncbi:MAG: hypothetical protein LBT16_08445 [Treponema sp.]|jgi:hypothetical protein|nr:hypothetical protein [Treponema sp.]
MEKLTFLAKGDSWYQKLGIEKTPQAREDGMRSDGQTGSYEWWYFDAEYPDGTKAVVGFYTKSGISTVSPPNPTTILTLTLPGGETIYKRISEGEGKKIRASRDICDVEINNSSVKYDHGGYVIHYEDDEITYDCVMEPKVPLWRPGTGHWVFGEEQKDFFAWFVPLASAATKATLTVRGKTTELSGTGYHDHNWGNKELSECFNHWYWCRAAVGDYTVIAVDIISAEKFGYLRLPVFYIAKDGVVLDDNEERVVIERGKTECHPLTDKFIDNDIVFIQHSESGADYRIAFHRTGDIQVKSLLESIGYSPEKIAAAKQMGVNPTYIRCVGDVSFSVTEKGAPSVTEDHALWEQMFFGSNKDAVIKG